MPAETTLNEALAAFDFGFAPIEAERYGHGHINDTFFIRSAPEDRAEHTYILQRINDAAFKKPDELMSNVLGVSEYLGRLIEERGGDRSRESMQFLRTRSGGSFFSDSEGRAWRAYRYIDGVKCFESADTPELFAASGRAFGRFQRMLSGYDATTLYETIPRFHDTEDRLRKLRDAIAADPMGRAKDCRAEISFALEREADCSVALQALRDGVLPLRVTHNDTKLNNILFDPETGEGICVIDLDTVMPGLAINDFGDSIRFGANHCAEDEKDLSRMYLDLSLYEAYARAFIEGAGGILTQSELRYLPWGARLMTLECGIRFLTDHLSGDVYYHIDRPEHNLDRCRTQFKLVRDMEEHWDEMCSIIKRITAV